MPPQFSEGPALLRTSQGVCSEECGEETGGGWVSLRRGCLIQRDPLVWRVLRPATSSPNCSFIPQTHEVLRHPWGCSCHAVLRDPRGTTPSQAPPRLPALGHQAYAEAAAFTPTDSPCLPITSLGLTPLMALCSRTFSQSLSPSR